MYLRLSGITHLPEKSPSQLKRKYTLDPNALEYDGCLQCIPVDGVLNIVLIDLFLF
jgi:hypothetical protein